MYSSVFAIKTKAYSVSCCKNTGLGKVNVVAVVELLQYRANECLGELFILSAPESRIPKPGT